MIAEDKAPPVDGACGPEHEVPDDVPASETPAPEGPVFKTIGLSLELQSFKAFEAHFQAPVDVITFNADQLTSLEVAYDSDKARRVTLPAGRMHFHPAETTVYTLNRLTTAGSGVVMAIDPTLRRALEAEVKGPSLSMRSEINIATPQAVMLNQMVHRFMQTGYSGGNLVAEGMAALAVTEALMALSGARPDAASEGARLSGPSLQRTLDYIEAHLEDDIRLADLAAIACLSPHHFSRAFKVSTGRPPSLYVLQRRVERAKTLLLSSDEPLTSIALQCGFSSQSHMTTAFRRMVAMTPARFRKEVRR